MNECTSALPNRAARLFLDGYDAERTGAETVSVRDPRGCTYRVNALFQTCDCRSEGACVHLLGYAKLLSDQQAYEEAQAAALEAQFNEWGLTLENDRTERILREMGVCEF
jgi:hypothetical protein